jgi:archaea-specific DNA-binding protein
MNEPLTPKDSEDRQESNKPERSKNDNTIFIGTKPFMNYINGVSMQFTTKNSPEVIIKARGKFISRAVDVAEVVRKRTFENFKVEVKNISIASEEFENKEGRQVNVSTIEITLMKK